MTVLFSRSTFGFLFIGLLVLATLVGGMVGDVADRFAFALTLVSVFRDLRLV